MFLDPLSIQSPNPYTDAGIPQNPNDIQSVIVRLPQLLPEIVRAPANPLPADLVPTLPSIVRGGAPGYYSLSCMGKPGVTIPADETGGSITDSFNCLIDQNPLVAVGGLALAWLAVTGKLKSRKRR